MFASEECIRPGQQTGVITFDQPLYAKDADDMVAAAASESELSSVKVRL